MDASRTLHVVMRHYGGLSKGDVLNMFSSQNINDVKTYATGWLSLKNLRVRKTWVPFSNRYVLLFPFPTRLFKNGGGTYMSIEQMRATIANVYNGEKWKTKVSKMSDGQVIAIYGRFLDKKMLKR